MAHRFDISARGRLESEERVRLLAPEATLPLLGFSAGRPMADLGCGTGLFTLPAARLNRRAGGDAKVYAVDISPTMLEEVSSRAVNEGLGNVVTVLSEEYRCWLDAETADFVLLCTVLHEVDDKVRLLGEAARICRAGGTAAVIEFVPGSDTRMGPPPAHRLSPGSVKESLLGAGFAAAREFALNDVFYAVTAVKPNA